MYSLRFMGILLGVVVSGIPLEANPFTNAPKWVTGYNLNSDDVIATFGDDTYVVKADDYLAWLKTTGVSIGPPELDPSWGSVNTSGIAEVETRNNGLEKRCDDNEYIITDKTETFIDWDVQMSPVLCAVGDMDVTVMEGYNVANSVTVSAGIEQTLVADLLKASLRIDYSESWTTLASTSTKGTVNDGECGVMITKPIVTRRSGRLFRGCVGSATEAGTWYADSHGQGSYNGIDWVQGAISMCKREQSNPPLTRCNGDGEFV